MDILVITEINLSDGEQYNIGVADRTCRIND